MVLQQVSHVEERIEEVDSEPVTRGIALIRNPLRKVRAYHAERLHEIFKMFCPFLWISSVPPANVVNDSVVERIEELLELIASVLRVHDSLGPMWSIVHT